MELLRTRLKALTVLPSAPATVTTDDTHRNFANTSELGTFSSEPLVLLLADYMWRIGYSDTSLTFYVFQEWLYKAQCIISWLGTFIWTQLLLLGPFEQLCVCVVTGSGFFWPVCFCWFATILLSGKFAEYLRSRLCFGARRKEAISRKQHVCNWAFYYLGSLGFCRSPGWLNYKLSFKCGMRTQSPPMLLSWLSSKVFALPHAECSEVYLSISERRFGECEPAQYLWW